MEKKFLRIDYSNNKNDYNDYNNFILFNPSNKILFSKINEILEMKRNDYLDKYGDYINDIVSPQKTQDIIYKDIAYYLKNNKFHEEWLDSASFLENSEF